MSRGLLVQYRTLAFTTATLLIILVFVGIPLQVFAKRPGLVNVVGTTHGFLYIGYLIVAFRVCRKLQFSKWKTLLILLAGTVPFCAFIAERKVSEQYVEASVAISGQRTPSHGTRSRWLSPRALLLHLEVLVVAPGCAFAGWWQATRALAGNELSWVYSVEWPCFALIAIWGWWHLVHEDPEAYRERRMRQAKEALVSSDRGPNGDVEPIAQSAMDVNAGKLARTFAIVIGAQFVLGFVTLGFVPLDQTGGWIPKTGEPVYVVHASVGILLAFAAILLQFFVRPCTRRIRVSCWLGISGLLLAALGGILVHPESLTRFVGLTLMLIGAVFAMFAYMVPTLPRSPDVR